MLIASDSQNNMTIAVYHQQVYQTFNIGYGH